MSETIIKDFEVDISQDEHAIGELVVAQTVTVPDMVIITPNFTNVDLPGRHIAS